MTDLRMVTAFVSIVLAGCTIPPGEPIGASRLTIGEGGNGASVVAVKSCPDWRRDSGEDFSNRTSSNFGCADALNFVGQLAVPADAIRGRASGPEDGEAAAAGVSRYRLRQATPSPAGSGASTSASAQTGEPR